MKNKILILFVFIFIAQLAGIIGSFFTAPNIKSWYQFLKKPSFSPPNWLFAPVWTALYALMGIAAFLVWQAGRQNENQKGKVKKALIIYGFQLLINIFWSFAFFGLKNPFFGFLAIIFLWFLILINTIYFWKINKTAGYLFLPYLFWVTFASILNFSVWQLN